MQYTVHTIVCHRVCTVYTIIGTCTGCILCCVCDQVSYSSYVLLQTLQRCSCHALCWSTCWNSHRDSQLWVAVMLCCLAVDHANRTLRTIHGHTARLLKSEHSLFVSSDVSKVQGFWNTDAKPCQCGRGLWIVPNSVFRNWTLNPKL